MGRLVKYLFAALLLALAVCAVSAVSALATVSWVIIGTETGDDSQGWVLVSMDEHVVLYDEQYEVVPTERIDPNQKWVDEQVSFWSTSDTWGEGNITLRAVPAEGYVFDHWGVSAVPGTIHSTAQELVFTVGESWNDPYGHWNGEYRIYACFVPVGQSGSVRQVAVCMSNGGYIADNPLYRVDVGASFVIPDYEIFNPNQIVVGWSDGYIRGPVYADTMYSPYQTITVEHNLYFRCLCLSLVSPEKMGLEVLSSGEGKANGGGKTPDATLALRVFPHGGTGKMVIPKYSDDSFVLPECALFPPEGKVFDSWLLVKQGDNLGNPETMAVVLPAGTTVRASFDLDVMPIWKDDPDAGSHSSTHVHSPVKVDAVAATCDVAGHEVYWRCPDCGKLFADAACTQEIDAPVAIPAGHDWGEWVITKEATSVAEGEKTRTCKRDPSHVETATIPIDDTPGYYSFTTGGEGSWAYGEDTLRFVVKRRDDDASTLQHFMGVEVDGERVPPLGYDVEAGSLVLTLKPAYLESLSWGTHEILVIFDDSQAQTWFTILEEREQEPAEEPEESSGLPVWAWIAIGIIGAGALVFAGAKLAEWRKKRQREMRRRERLARLEESDAKRAATRTPHVRR